VRNEKSGSGEEMVRRSTAMGRFFRKNSLGLTKGLIQRHTTLQLKTGEQPGEIRGTLYWQGAKAGEEAAQEIFDTDGTKLHLPHQKRRFLNEEKGGESG